MTKPLAPARTPDFGWVCVALLSMRHGRRSGPFRREHLAALADAMNGDLQRAGKILRSSLI